jgi:hypothetical protein
VPSVTGSTRFTPATSNGTTLVQVGPNASSGLAVVLTGVLFANPSANFHTLDVLSSGGGVIFKSLPLPSSGGFFLDVDGGVFRSDVGEFLQFRIDSGGSATDVILSGFAAKK